MDAAETNIISDDFSSQIESFSQEEREEILEQIEKISSQSYIKTSPELFEVNPTKKGGTLPLFINIIGLLIIISGFFFTSRYFQAKEENIVLGEKRYTSTEGSVVKALKRQSEAQIKQKQQEISKIQSELEKLDKESSKLKATMDDQIKAKEKELTIQMQQELEKERTRLKNTGVSSAELEKKLKEFETQKQVYMSNTLKSFKTQSENALKEKEQQLAQAKKIAQQILDKANRDKAALEENAKKREDQLKKQFEKEKKTLIEQSSNAEKKLLELNQQQHNEQLVQDQITSSYATIITRIKSGNYPEAELAINDLRKLLTDPKIKYLTNINKRLGIENFILDSLENEIKQGQTENTTDFTTLTQAAQTLLNARANIIKGDESAKKGDMYTATRFYNTALASLPHVKTAITSLQKIEAKNLESHAKEYITLGDSSFRKGNLKDAVTQYRNGAVTAVNINKKVLSTSINKLESALALMRKNIEDKNDAAYRNLKNNLGKKISSLQMDLDTKKSEIDKLNSILQNEQSKKSDLEKQLNDLNMQMTNLQKENSLLTSKLSKRDSSIKTLNEQLAKSSVRIQNLTKRVKQTEKKISSLQKELDDAVNQIVDLINS